MENIDEIVNIANKCLNCKHKPCQNACPMKTNIPEFISKVKEKKFGEAYEILLSNNIFSNICSIICPQEQQCQGSCVRGIKGEPMPIGRLERFVNDWANENNYKIEHTCSKKKNKRVAVIGSRTCWIIMCSRAIKKRFFSYNI